MNQPASDINTSQAVARDTPLRFVTAASLFDGHDAAINIMRRLIQAQGCEVIHLGHNRGVLDIVRAAIQEDADAIAVSSYQGGHNEFFRFMIDQLEERGAGHIQVFAGGGGTITLEEIADLQAYGVNRIYHPDDGMHLGLVEMIEDVVQRAATHRKAPMPPTQLRRDNAVDVAQMLTALETGLFGDAELEFKRREWAGRPVQAPVIGITGTGGSGKSSVTDELLNRLLSAFPEKRIAILAVDPTSAMLNDSIRFLKSAGFDLVIVETAGIGQSDSEIVDMVDFPCYVMTSEFGAQSQLEKIDMLDFADLVVLNKFDKRGAEDALRDIRKQWRRNHNAFQVEDTDVPVYPTIASQFNDPGLSWMFVSLIRLMRVKLGLPEDDWTPDIDVSEREPQATVLIPGSRVRYLAEIAEQGREINTAVEHQARSASLAQNYYECLKDLGDPELPAAFDAYRNSQLQGDGDYSLLRQRYNVALSELSADAVVLMRDWPERKRGIRTEQYSYEVRGREIIGDNFRESLSRLQIPKIGMPRDRDWGELLSFLMRENLPGGYPYTAGVFPYRRAGEDPTRMFAGEGTPERTNRRFHYLSKGGESVRLSTAFDSVTLYGEDPHTRPDIYGKVGNSGVSIATLDDLKKLYSGFDLLAPNTSVSMTINGPAPMMLAFFMNAAIDQQVEKHLDETGGWNEANRIIRKYFHQTQPVYAGELPDGNQGLGLRLLGITGDKVVDAGTYERIKKETIAKVRGTVQADILKEDQAQNTCIFSTEFAMRMMGDIQQYFVDNMVRNFYSVSISGYHIAEAGANPISQLAFTLSNGLTIVEYYLARGMHIDEFAPNLSFFFSNGMDPAYLGPCHA